jgi:Ni,Fe-hydrogenase III large subunit
LSFTVPVYREGDVLRRMQVRIDEVQAALAIIEQFLPRLPGGPTRVACPLCPPTRLRLATWKGGAERSSTGFAPDEAGRLARCKIKDPSLQNWPALSEAILGNIIPDFPW